MTSLMATEWLKLRTVRAPALLALVTVLLSLLLALQPVLGAGRQGRPSLGTVGAMLGVLDATSMGPLLALVLGVLVLTGEQHHATLSATLLQTPVRVRLVAAKAVVASLAGLVLGTLGLLTTLAVGVPTGAVRLDLLNPDIVSRALGLLAGYPVYAVLGVGVGALLTYSQPVAVLLPLAWLLVMEDMVVGAIDRHLLPWTVAGATEALGNAGDVADVLPVWAGAAVLVGYTMVALVAGAVRVDRADIT